MSPHWSYTVTLWYCYSNVCLSVSLSVSVCLSVCLSLSVSLSASLCVWLSICLSLCLSVCVSVCLSVCLSVTIHSSFAAISTVPVIVCCSETWKNQVSGRCSARHYRGLRLGSKTIQQIHVVQGATLLAVISNSELLQTSDIALSTLHAIKSWPYQLSVISWCISNN